MKKLTSKLFSKSVDSAELNMIKGGRIGGGTTQRCTMPTGNSPETCDSYIYDADDSGAATSLPYTVPC